MVFRYKFNICYREYQDGLINTLKLFNELKIIWFHQKTLR